ncbi:hypothetical protein LVD15_03230 [Fulvivirga maritima]|uniref:DUF6249 domain-containing protein n=1 Tax=Fulvivirga maritima TaxID=2904247 RepID=UPI001F41527B|nr:DUF6249 domain-containing protein [Fulvivirga maritima]UII27458.1 hypothetical protein LVD15_03230 [Fulvivirga maritima]
MQILALSVPILAVIGIVLVIIFLRKYTNNERMALIEKGINRSEWLASGGLGQNNLALRLGFLFVGVGCGILVGELLREFAGFRPPVAYLSMLFLFGGIGLFVSYLIEEKKNKEK